MPTREELLAEVNAAKSTTCSVKGCSRQVYAVALCSPHYRRLRTTGDVQANVPLRIARYEKSHKCATCGRKSVYAKMLCKRCYDHSRTGHGGK